MLGLGLVLGLRYFINTIKFYYDHTILNLKYIRVMVGLALWLRSGFGL